MSATIVKRAIYAFQQGDYHDAKQLYLKAANKYGHQLFNANLTLCDQRLKRSQSRPVTAALTPNDSPTTILISQQLADTQQLLEHYYNRCQELEYQLIEKN